MRSCCNRIRHHIRDDSSDKRNSVTVGHERPRLLRTGNRGRPQKQYKVLSLMYEDLIETPNSVVEAFDSSYSNEWKASIKMEFDAVRNDTWDLVDLPHDDKAIGPQVHYKG